MVKIVLTTLDDEKVAAEIASLLVEEKLAACVSIVKDVLSVYRWEGSVVKEKEVMLVCKTGEKTLDPMIERLKGLHKYELPEILIVDAGSTDAYRKWVEESCGNA